MTKKRQKGKPKVSPNNLPSHIGESFLEELKTTVFDLPDSFKARYLGEELLAKYSDPTTTSADVRRERALKKWRAVEERNRVTNYRLFLSGEDFGWSTSDIITDDAKEIIRQVLGSFEPSKIFIDPSHTNGASTRIRRSPKALIDKHEGEAHLSSTAMKHWFNLTALSRMEEQDVSLQESSEFFTVPKSTDIDRVACKEPEANMLLQRCVGGYIRRRLKIFGINLNDQTKNQNLARVALKKGLATVDLSSASDTITKQLVMDLLPGEYWSLLEDLRVHWTNIDGALHRLEMFSSMGNGFTFELESLIFWALTRSICKNSGVKGTISVYGDDIICPSAIGPRLKRTFAWYGFTVNAKKSHWSGQFRESCGKHYHGKTDVTPFFVRKPISEKTEMIRLLNRLLVWDADPHFKCFTTPSIANFHKKWSEQIPKRLWGGVDPNDITSLVTGHAPRERLLPRSRPIQFNENFGLEAWLLMTFSLQAESLAEDIIPVTSLLRDRIDPTLDFDSTSFVPSKEYKWEIADPEVFRIRGSSVFDAGEVTKWDPYMIYGSS